MSKKSNYISTNRSKHHLKCHLIFVCKYRKPMLVGQLNDDIKQIFQSIANVSDFEIEVMETDKYQIIFEFLDTILDNLLLLYQILLWCIFFLNDNYLLLLH